MQAFARSIVETVRHPLLVLDAKLRVVSANAPFYRTFGGTSPEIDGRDVFALDGGRWDHPRLRTLLHEVIPQNGSFEDVEISYDAPGLGQRVMVLNARRVVRQEDGATMVLLAIEDETIRRHEQNVLRELNVELEQRVAARTVELAAANQDLLETNQELESTNRELEAFCYSVSHDLRAPLRAIDGFSAELLSGSSERLEELGQHYLRRIRAGTQRMGQLIDDLLKLSRVSRSEMRREPVDLSALAQLAFSELREREPDRTVVFTARPGMTVECDAALIRVVLDNLIGNAWKFTSRNPTATIAFDQIEFEGRTAFVVRDDGAGFDMAYAGKLFGAFQRLHSDREFPGTGIGLATVQRIVHRHGGKIWATGVIGGGAEFFFTLPRPESRV